MATCAHCGFESDGIAVCPLCGGTMRVAADDADAADAADAAGAHASGAGAGGTEPPAGELPAWEDGRTPFPRNVIETWKTSVLDPGRFFRGVPYDAPAARPILYFLLVGVTGALFNLLWTGVASRSENALFRGAYIPIGSEFDGTFTLIGFFLTPFAAIVGLFAGAAVVHLFVLIVARDRRPYGATVRMLCYASGPALFQVIPVVGGLVQAIWTLVLLGAGVRAGHRTGTGGAVAIVLMSVLIPLFGFFMLAMCVILTLAPSAL